MRDFEIKTDDISPAEAMAVWQVYRRQLVADLIGVFLLAAFLMAGGAWIVLSVFCSLRYNSIAAVGIGSCCGLLGVIYILVKELRHYVCLRSDLKSKRCEQLTVDSDFALAVELTNSASAIALNCGAYTLLLLGNWRTDRRRTDISWSPASAHKSFPSTSFSIRRLPRSGHVVSVDVNGTKLKVARNETMLPELELDVPGFMDSFYTNAELDTLKLNLFQERETPSGCNGPANSE